MIILAFDLATKTGVAVGETSGGPLRFTEVLGEAGDPHSARFLQALRMTKRLIETHRPDVIASEAPIASGVVGKVERSQLAMGLRACVMAMAHQHQVRFVEYKVNEVRKYFIGRGNLKRQAAKLAVFQHCKMLGWACANDNESDACAVWDYARFRLARKSHLPAGGLFGNDLHSE